MTRWSGCEVEARGFDLGQRPRRLRRQLGDLAGEHGETGLVGVCGRQSDLDAGDHFGPACGDLDQFKRNGVELGVTPERGFWEPGSPVYGRTGVRTGELPLRSVISPIN